MKINKDELEIKFKIIEEKKLKAIGSLNFGEFVVKGFRIMDSQFQNEHGDNLWLTPPVYRDSRGGYHPIFFIPNKEQWKEIESFIWDEYYKQSKEHHKKRFGLDEEPKEQLEKSDIPF